MEKTLIIVKPHAAARGLTVEFLARFERMGLRIAAIKVITGDAALWERFYPSDETWFANVGGKTLEDAGARGLDVKERLGTENPAEIGRLVKGWLVDHMSGGLGDRRRARRQRSAGESAHRLRRDASEQGGAGHDQV